MVKDGEIRVSCGCFLGNLEQFAAQVQKTHEQSRYGDVYRQAIKMAQTHILIPSDDVKEVPAKADAN